MLRRRTTAEKDEGRVGTKNKRTTVSIVGAGRLGTALARALASRGYTIEAVVARRKTQARRAARQVGTEPQALASSELDKIPASDILFITTPDDAVTETAARLSENFRIRKQVGRRRATALHASGALSSDALRSLREAGFSTGSMHPLVSVSDSIQGAESLCSAFFCIEGEAAARQVARLLVRALGAKSFSVSARDKALYHAAAVMTSGHTTALFDLALEMLTRCGLTRRRARAVLLPLLKSTFENLVKSDPSQALTGTFRRADAAIVRKHLAALRSQKMEDALAVYALLGARSLQLASAAGARGEALKEIARELEAVSKGKCKP